MFRWISRLIYGDQPEPYVKSGFGYDTQYRRPKQYYAILDTDGHMDWNIPGAEEYVQKGKDEGWLVFDKTIRAGKDDQVHIYRMKG